MTKFTSPNSWRSAMHEKHHDVSVVLCQALEKLMKYDKLTFARAYEKLLKEKRISHIDGNYGLAAEE